jgi:hypothetical protein
MPETCPSADLQEYWHSFLTDNLDARVVVDRVMARTGFTEHEVLFFLMGAWAEHNLSVEQRREFDNWAGPWRSRLSAQGSL